MSKKETAVEAPEANVLTIDLASIKAYEQLKRITNLSEGYAKDVKSLLAYIEEAGIQDEINFSDERLVKSWYALNMKHEDGFFPSLGSSVEDWVLLSEYMRSFTPSDDNYDALLTVLQSSIIQHWGGSDIFENKVELNESDFLAYQTAVAVIWNTPTWDRLPNWYQEFLKEDAPDSYLTASERKLKELYELLKAA